MIQIEYKTDFAESANATVDFLMNRPLMHILFFIMNIACVGVCIGFVITLYEGNVHPSNLLIALLALFWLFCYKTVNRFIITRSLRMQHGNSLTQQYQVNKRRISWKTAFKLPCHVEWDKIRFIYENKEGYIIPLTGRANAAKFLWFPIRGFQTDEQRQAFIDIIKDKEKAIKPVRSKR